MVCKLWHNKNSRKFIITILVRTSDLIGYFLKIGLKIYSDGAQKQL